MGTFFVEVLLAAPTRPGAFSTRLVTARRYGGGMPEGFRVRDGALWDGERLVATPEEADLFAALGLPWLPPEARTDTVRPVRRDGRLGWHDPARPAPAPPRGGADGPPGQQNVAQALVPVSPAPPVSSALAAAHAPLGRRRRTPSCWSCGSSGAARTPSGLTGGRPLHSWPSWTLAGAGSPRPSPRAPQGPPAARVPTTLSVNLVPPPFVAWYGDPDQTHSQVRPSRFVALGVAA